MSDVKGRSGRKQFVATQEQRDIVKGLAGRAVPQALICRVILNPQTEGCEASGQGRTSEKQERLYSMSYPWRRSSPRPKQYGYSSVALAEDN